MLKSLSTNDENFSGRRNRKKEQNQQNDTQDEAKKI